MIHDEVLEVVVVTMEVARVDGATPPIAEVGVGEEMVNCVPLEAVSLVGVEVIAVDCTSLAVEISAAVLGTIVL